MPYKDPDKAKAYKQAYGKTYWAKNKDQIRVQRQTGIVKQRKKDPELAEARRLRKQTARKERIAKDSEYYQRVYARAKETRGSEHINETARNWRREHPDKVREFNRRRQVRMRGLTGIEAFWSLFHEQGGRCAICTVAFVIKGDGPYARTSCHIDHCHTSGKVRALLCNNCNRNMSAIDDDEYLTQLITYRDRFRISTPGTD